MKKTVFYSWQSDLPHETNNEFIKSSIENALNNINENLEIHSSPRGSDQILELDHDIRNIPGSPPIADTIFDKIDNCSIFIADLSFVAQTEKNVETGFIKCLPNSNVLIEYGYAYKSVGYNKIIGIMNTAFGKPTPANMPFNLRHIDFPIQYELEPDFDTKAGSKNRTLLMNLLEEKIKLISESDQNVVGSLSAEFLEDNSKFYILPNKKILLILHLKISNRDTNPTSINISKVEILYEDKWIKAVKSKFNQKRIDTIKGSVITGFLEGKVISYEQDARVEAMDTKDFYFRFQLDTINHERIIEPIRCRGEIYSLDNKYCYFEGNIKAYR